MKAFKKFLKTKLQFGNKKHIELRNQAWADLLSARLIKKVKCPFCGAKASHIYNFDYDAEMIGWNFECKPSCRNSIEYGEENGYDTAKTHTDLNGKFIAGL